MTDKAAEERTAGAELDLEPIKAREALATKGPWSADAYRVQLEGVDDYVDSCLIDTKHQPFYNARSSEEADQAADMAFIAHAREDIPALIAEVERLRVEHTRAILHYTVKGYTAGENTDAKHWRERAEKVEAEVSRLRAALRSQPEGKEQTDVK